MSEDTRVINAITGKILSVNIKYFTSFNDLKEFIELRWGIPSNQSLILIPFGNKLNQKTFETFLNSKRQNFQSSDQIVENETASLQNEFYVYDRRLFSLINEPCIIDIKNDNPDTNLIKKAEDLLVNIGCDDGLEKELSLIKPVISPLTQVNLSRPEFRTYHKITTALTTNLGWLNALLIDVYYLENLVKDISNEILDIIKCLFNMDQYLKIYSFDVESLYNSNVTFLNQLSDIKNNSKWEDCYNILDKLIGIDNTCLQQYVDKVKLDNHFNDITTLDSKINSDLIKVKSEIDKNFNYRNDIQVNIKETEVLFKPSSEKYELEDKMLSKFREIVDNIKDTSHKILEKEMTEFNEEFTNEIVENVVEAYQKEAVATLYTISQALFAKVENFVKLKQSLKVNSLLIMGQIAFSQMDILNMKKFLLKDCNKNLKKYQEVAAEFTHVEDIPITYGLFLIELYRRNTWFLKSYSKLESFANNFWMMRDREQAERRAWFKSFGSIASMFTTDIIGLHDFDQLKELLSDKQTMSSLPGEIITSHQNQLENIVGAINMYMEQLNNLGVAANILGVLSKKLVQVHFYKESLEKEDVEAHAKVEQQISYYKGRVSKLESLLHYSILNNPSHWPSGIISTSNFQNNTSSLNAQLLVNSQLLSSIPALEVKDVEQIQSLRDEISKLENTNRILEQRTAIQNGKLSDLQLEGEAYRETLDHLNKELSRLTELEETRQRDDLDKALEYKNELRKFIDQNTINLKEQDMLTEELQKSKKRIEELESIKKIETDQCKDKLNQLEGEIFNLKAENDKLNQAIQNSTKNVIFNSVETQTEVGTLDNNTQTEDRFVDVNFEQDADIIKHIKFLQSKIFAIFRSNIFILENIGLLLVSDQTSSDMNYSNDNNGVENLLAEAVEIKRVKGLKKQLSQSLLNESTQLISDTNEIVDGKRVIKSSVFKNIKRAFDGLLEDENQDTERQFFTFIEKLYSDDLYEEAVIRRFKDIESLAKKLTKEVKAKKVIIEKSKMEKITLREFQVGDLALFLPTKENGMSAGVSAISSLNSSFSSVDLSTPPPAQSHLGTGIVSIKSGNTPLNKDQQRIQPWAAFTAFNDSTRYFFCNQTGDPTLKNEEWFIGRVTHLEKSIVGNDHVGSTGSNPYKLPEGTVWYQVTADIMSHHV